MTFNVASGILEMILLCKGNILLSILMASVICVDFQPTCTPLCNIGIHLILNILMPRYQINTLERQVSRGSTKDEVVDHECNLAYASKHGK